MKNTLRQGITFGIVVIVAILFFVLISIFA